MIKIYECLICKKLKQNNVKDIERYIGTREDVRRHIRVEHHIKGQKNTQHVSKKNFGPSEITVNTLATEWTNKK